MSGSLVGFGSIRAPAESISQTIGIRLRSASSRRRVTLVSPVKPMEPPLTVKSYAAAATLRPSTLPQPHTTASAGTYCAPGPISVPWMPIST